MLRPASRRHGLPDAAWRGPGSWSIAAGARRRVMGLGPAARVAATATGIIAVVYVLGVIVLNLVVSARLDQHNDNRLADRLAAARHDPDVFSQHARHILRRGRRRRRFGAGFLLAAGRGACGHRT